MNALIEPPVTQAYAARRRQRGAGRLWARDLVVVAGYAIAATAVAIFLADGGLRRFGSLGGALTGIGIVSGLLATVAVVLMLLLAARVPLIDRAMGQDKAIALHARLGRYAFLGLVAHAGFLLLGYAVSDGLDPVGEFGQLWRTPDLVLAVLGLALLALVAGSSIVAARRLLPYGVWHVIHLVTYAAVLVSLPHQFSMGGLFADGPAFWFWAGLFGLAAFCLVNYRLLHPLIASATHRLVVRRIVNESPDTVSIELTGRRLDEMAARGGQYFHWRFLAPGLWHVQHPFSLSAGPDKSTLRITVRALGRGTSRLMRTLRPGTAVLIEGPYGVFTDAARTREHLVAVGIGIGITSVRALLEDASVAPGQATVILRARSRDDLPLTHEIEALCRDKGARLIVLLGRRDGRVESWLPGEYARAGWHLSLLVPNLGDADVFVCGPRAAAELVIADARAAGVGEDQIHNERFSW